MFLLQKIKFKVRDLTERKEKDGRKMWLNSVGFSSQPGSRSFVALCVLCFTCFYISHIS